MVLTVYLWFQLKKKHPFLSIKKSAQVYQSLCLIDFFYFQDYWIHSEVYQQFVLVNKEKN